MRLFISILIDREKSVEFFHKIVFEFDVQISRYFDKN